jgi:glycerol-3-phosphate dehydrogenase
MLGAAESLDGLGQEVAPGLYAAEIDYLAKYEWASSAEDILWRRSKLGLHLAPACAPAIDAWLAARQKARV